MKINIIVKKNPNQANQPDPKHRTLAKVITSHKYNESPNDTSRLNNTISILNANR